MLQNFKKTVRVDPKLRGWAIFGLKMAHLLWPNFFWVQTIVITFTYLLVLFIVQNFKKSWQRIQSYDNAPFLYPKLTICPKKYFPISFWCVYYPLSLCKIKKNSSSGSRVMRMCNFWTQNVSFPQKRVVFFRKPGNESCFFHSSLSACLMIKEYWNLIGWEPFLSIT